MATVNFSIPADIAVEFDATFKGQNKSAIVARLMRQAVDDVQLQRQRKALIAKVTRSRPTRPATTHTAIMAARAAGRP